MAVSKRPPKFNVNGPHSKDIARWCLGKAVAAKHAGISPLEADYSWDTFLEENRHGIVAAITRDHPGKPDDPGRKARDNQKTQAERFCDWLVDGGRFPKTFQQETGLLASGLAGSCGNQKPGQDDGSQAEEVDDPEEEDTGFQSPFANTTTAPTPKKPPGSISFADVAADLEELVIDEEGDSEMQIITIHKPNVPVRNDVVKTRDLLAVQARLVGGTVLESVEIEVNEEDPNEVTIVCTVDKSTLEGASRVKRSWQECNESLATELEALFDQKAKTEFPDGKTTATFNWEGGLKSTLNPIDPYNIKLRGQPTRFGDPLFDTKKIKLRTRKGGVVECYIMTAFFYVEKPASRRSGAGRNFQLSSSSDEDDSQPNTPKKRRRPGKPKDDRNFAAGSKDSADGMEYSTPEN